MSSETWDRTLIETVAQLSVALQLQDRSPEAAKLRLEVFARSLKAYSAEEIQAAAYEIIDTPGRVWFPSVGEMLEVLNEQRRVRRLAEEKFARDEQIAKALDEPHENAEQARAAFKQLVKDLERKMRWGGDVPPQ